MAPITHDPIVLIIAGLCALFATIVVGAWIASILK